MCDTVVVVEPGRVWFAKNSDRDPNEAQSLDWQPAGDHQAGAHLRCTWVTIPQVEHTHAVLLSRPFWMWGAEMGANEHGVVVGNEAVFTDRPVRRQGLTGMDLNRLCLERASTAAEGVEVITSLLERYGQGGRCGHEHASFRYHNSFLVADATGAWVVETADDQVAVEQVTGGARSISNALTIEPFASEHADRLRGRVARAAQRRDRSCTLAASASDPTDLFGVLRDHGRGEVGPDWSVLTGAMAAPCMHAGGLVASSQTTGSWVSELTPGGARHWATATSAPCTGLFKPVAVADPVDLGPFPTDRDDPATVWWRHERRHRLLVRNLDALLPGFASARDEVERAWVADPRASRDAFAEADHLLDGWLATALDGVGAPDRRPAPVRRYWQVRNDRAGLALPQVVLPTGVRAR